jgi:peptidoglycan/xylan/chitin deacetylase (PgdA/CDA1 family)
MTRALSELAKQLLWTTGHYARRLRGDVFPGVAVLGYHGVRADDWSTRTMAFEELHVRARELDEHCRLLREYCHPISLSDWLAALDGGSSLPERPVLVTFDDGYRTVLSLAGPILQRYAIPAVVFACTDPIEQQQLFWHDAVAHARGEAAVASLKSVPFDEWQRVATECQLPAATEDPHAPLSIDELRVLATQPGIEIGSHTATHPILARASLTVQRAQVRQSKARLEAWIEKPVRAFAYPNGQPEQDYTRDTTQLVHASDFSVAFSTRAGFATVRESRWEYSRFLMLAGLSAAELAHRLCYSWRRE